MEGLNGEIKLRFQMLPCSRAFLKSSIFGGQFLRISVDGRPNRRNKAPFSKSYGVVWSGPDCHFAIQAQFICCT